MRLFTTNGLFLFTRTIMILAIMMASISTVSSFAVGKSGASELFESAQVEPSDPTSAEDLIVRCTIANTTEVEWVKINFCTEAGMCTIPAKMTSENGNYRYTVPGGTFSAGLLEIHIDVKTVSGARAWNNWTISIKDARPSQEAENDNNSTPGFEMVCAISSITILGAIYGTVRARRH